MAHRSDRREDKPKNLWDSRARPDKWLLARGFHFGQEGKGPILAIPLHSQAGDTSAGLTHRHRRRAPHQSWFSIRIRGPTLRTLDGQEESRYKIFASEQKANSRYGRPDSS
jgi:hypothetical protein